MRTWPRITDIAEALEPGVNDHRTTFSAIYNLPLGRDTNWSNTFVWDKPTKQKKAKRNRFFLNQITREIATRFTPGSNTSKNRCMTSCSPKIFTIRFPIYSAAIGYVRDLTHRDGLDVGFGSQLTISHRPKT